ncbi:acyltransferase family protein [Pseudactinotalea sp. HY158]|nr:acyltransferase family protein [Pseudactinotalea sp. HY158]
MLPSSAVLSRFANPPRHAGGERRVPADPSGGPAAPPRHAARPRREATAEGVFRHELHGVRGLALSLVVLFHLFGNGRVSGGIDVFLAITGFLFTGSLLRRAIKGNGRISLVQHFGRLGQRLLPPILPVLLAVAVGAYFLLPESRWLQVARELRATILYYENWELVGSQLDYNAAGADTSPLQHFWSLSVQGQFYLVAPLVVMAVTMLALRLQVSPRWALVGVLALVLVGSLSYSVYLTAVDQPVAYFHSGARMWEFALGGLAALLLPYVKLSMRGRVVSGWAGIAMIATCGLIFDGGNLFPGYLAAWPVIGMILVLAGGMTTSPWGVDRLLVTKPFTFAADISYSLYLWHWPILIFVLATFGLQRIGPLEAVAILSASVGLAWLSKRFIEDPAQNWRFVRSQGRKFAWAVASVTVVALTTGAAASSLSQRQDALLAQAIVDGGEYPGAAVLMSGEPISLDPYEPGDVVPDLTVLSRDLPAIYDESCVQSHRDGFDEVLVCRDVPADPLRRVVMTGGSHIGQWWPAMSRIAEEQSWELILLEKGGCHLTVDWENVDGLGFNDSCRDWNRDALPLIAQLEPDLVFTLGTTTKGGYEHVAAGAVGAWSKLADAGIPIVAVRDTPRLEESAAECLERVGVDPRECGQPRDASLEMASPMRTAEGIPVNVTPLDLTAAFCDATYCPAVAGDTIVMRDEHHVSATYMRTVTPFLELGLRDAAGFLFSQ